MPERRVKMDEVLAPVEEPARPMRRITVDIPDTLHKRSKMYALQNDVSLSAAVEALLAGWVEGKIDVDAASVDMRRR